MHLPLASCHLPGPGRKGCPLLCVGLHALLLTLSPTQVLACILVGHLASPTALSCTRIQASYQTLQTIAVHRLAIWALQTGAKMTSTTLDCLHHKTDTHSCNCITGCTCQQVMQQAVSQQAHKLRKGLVQ